MTHPTLVGRNAEHSLKSQEPRAYNIVQNSNEASCISTVKLLQNGHLSAVLDHRGNLQARRSGWSEKTRWATDTRCNWNWWKSLLASGFLGDLNSHCSHFHSLGSSHPSILAAPQEYQVHACLGAVAFTLPSAWNALLSDVEWVSPSLYVVLCSNVTPSERSSWPLHLN